MQKNFVPWALLGFNRLRPLNISNRSKYPRWLAIIGMFLQNKCLLCKQPKHLLHYGKRIMHDTLLQ